jgi:uncharacterized cupredoxin-like copper-binding protein
VRKAPVEYNCPYPVFTQDWQRRALPALLARHDPIPRRSCWQGTIPVKVRMRAASCLLALLVASAVGSCDNPQTVDLTLIDDEFIPDHLTFQHDVYYRLHIENHGKETHEVTAPVFFASAKIDNPNVLNGYRTDVVLQPGETKDLYFTALHPGTYDLRCADHDWNGMLGGITVE